VASNSWCHAGKRMHRPVAIRSACHINARLIDASNPLLLTKTVATTQHATT
jgi:hypothetical protein